MIKTGNIVERLLDLVDKFVARSRPGLDVQAGLGIETGPKELEELPRDVDVLAQRLGEIGLAIGHADLPQIAADGPQHTDVAPVQICPHDQRVVSVRLTFAVVGGRKGLHKPLPGIACPATTDGIGATRHLDPEVVNERLLIIAHGQLVGPLVDHIDAQHR